MKHKLLLFFGIFSSICGFSQHSFGIQKSRLIPLAQIDFFAEEIDLNDTVKVQSVSDSVQRCQPKHQINFLTTLDFFSAFTAIHIVNGSSTNDKSNIHLYYNFTGDNRIKISNYSITNYFNTELGVKVYVDSFAIISEDSYTFKNDFSYVIKNSKLALNMSFTSRSQFFRHYDYRSDTTGYSVRFLNTSFLSPGYILYSSGIKILFNNYLNIEFGLVSAQKIKIRNQQLFDSRMSENLYGLSKGDRQKIDFGFSMTFISTLHQIHKNVYWENFSQFSVNRQNIKYLKFYQCNINNAFHYCFLKYLRLTLRSKITYDYNNSLKPRVINSLTFGFYLNNRL